MVLIFLLGSALPALADYLGPDRTRTQSEVETYDYGVWASQDDLSCNPTNDPRACIQCTWERDPFTASCAINPPTDHYYWYKLGTRSEVVTTTVTYPEATISASLQNCTPQNGWCRTIPNLSLSASEPVAGYQITLIEGTRNGESFACSGATCDIPLLEGENTFTFWALSSWGDSSRMGSLTAKVDTRPPQINGTTNGTPGEDGWYLSPVTVSASASDPEPGSGLQALTYALDGGAWTPYTDPLTLSDGEHALTFRAADRAGHSAEASVNVRVDTQPPAVQTALDGEQANGWYLSQVTFTAAASDGGSGLARIEYAADGGAWQPYTAPVTFGDGRHVLQVRAIDLAGNAAEAAPLTFQVDGAPPRIRLTDAWYIWENGAVQVHDEQSGLVSVEVEIRDGQGRWQKVKRAYEANGETFTTTIAWDRRFADGTLAPSGSYEVVVKAYDRAGNAAQETARIVIPTPNATVTPHSSFNIPQSSFTPPAATQTASSVFSLPAQPAPTATRAAVASAFQSSQSPITTYRSSIPAAATTPSTPLWGAAALAAAAAAAAYALEQRRKRKEEEARQAAEAQEKAARRNAAEALQRIQNWLIGQHIQKQQEEAARQAQQRAMNAKIARMEEAEGAALAAAMKPPVKPQRAEQAYQAYRAGERNAEAIAADYQSRKAIQDFRAGERASYDVPPPVPMCTPPVFDKPKPWWIPSFSVQEASQLVRIIPSVEVASNRIPVPVAKIVAPGKMISFGTVTAWNFGSNANPGAELRTDGFGAGTINESDKPSAFARVNPATAEISSSIRFPGGLGFKQDGFSSALGYSINAYAKWDGWNTTASIELNYADVETSGAGMKGNISKGVYLEVKPLQVAMVTVSAAALVLTPWPDELSLPALIDFLGNLVRNPTLGVP